MTFTAAFTITKPSLLDRVRHALDPPPFCIKKSAFPALLAQHHHNAAQQLLTPSLWIPASATKNSLRRKDAVTLYYPGCGQDLVWPLLLLNALANTASQWRLLCQDTTLTLGALISTIQQLTGNNVYSRFEHREGEGACFRFQDKTIHLMFFHSNALDSMPAALEQGYDIYFERGFDFCKSQSPGFIDYAIASLRAGGIAITDQGFSHVPASLSILTAPPPPPWGFYKQPTFYKKRVTTHIQ